jgi:hypothetical protein
MLSGNVVYRVTKTETAARAWVDDESARRRERDGSESG